VLIQLSEKKKERIYDFEKITQMGPDVRESVLCKTAFA
jgi:hypothetical protein